MYEYAAHHPAAEVVSWDRPRAVVFKSFLTPEEVGHVIAVAKDNLERSHVLSAQENDEVDDVRTSYGAWPPQDSVLESINERIHRLTGIPYSFGEDLYVLNYKLGQKYNAYVQIYYCFLGVFIVLPDQGMKSGFFLPSLVSPLSWGFFSPLKFSFFSVYLMQA